LDLDPQGDASRWAQRHGSEAVHVKSTAALRDAMAATGNTVVDCPPGQSTEALTAVALADFLIIPCRSGDADMVALGRSLDVARRVRAARPEMQVGVVLNLARETGRAKGIESALRSQAGQDFLWLGKLSARVGVEEAYASGKTLLEVGGSVAHEFRSICNAVGAIIETHESVAS
jgi:cellulose biosynthesis protein BcsQ